MKSRNRKLVALCPLVLATLTLQLITIAHAGKNATAIERVGGDIKYLASNELEGRGPGTKGLQKAAEFIRDEFKKAGLKSGTEDGTYMQHFEVSIDTKVIEKKTRLILRGPDGQELRLEAGKDFQPLATGGTGSAKAEVVFAGYGISADKQNYDDYENANVAGKVILVIRREPQQGDEKSVFGGKRTTSHSYIRTKLGAAKQQKAAAVLLINDPFTTKTTKNDQLTAPGGFGTSNSGIPFAHIKQEVANQLLRSAPVETADGEKLVSVQEIEEQIDETLQPMSQPLKGWTAELEFTFDRVKAKVANVIGILEGEGPLANETIVIGAHFDHLGYGPFGSRKPNVRAIHNGADDNATGTAAVIELARRFGSRDKKPARRMIFIGFNGEERGLIGSNFYVENPIVPLKDTVAMINFDMIGHLKEEGLTLGGARSGKEFPKLVEKAMSGGDLKVKAAGQIGGSDHSGFYRKGIPVFAFFTGLTKLYHTPEDDFETINVDGVVQIVDFADRLLQEVVAMPKRPEFVKANPTPRGQGSMAYLGVVPDYSADDDGLRISDVSADGPADKGGLKAGDVITKIGDVPVGDIQGLATGLRKYKPGNKVKIVVKRGKEEKTFEVLLAKP